MVTETEAHQIQTSCQEIINCISESSLNYSVKLTPYSLYITIRKSFSKAHVPSCSFQSQSEKSLLKQQVQTLEDKLKEMEIAKDTLQCRLEEELNYNEEIKNEMRFLKEKTVQSENDREKSYKQNRACKEENLELRGSLMSLETELKVLKKALVEKEKDIHDLGKEKKTKEDKLEDLKATLAAVKKKQIKIRKENLKRRRRRIS